jgi:ABC-type dipeptide/oligopeptide/nickel transport system permease subunit
MTFHPVILWTDALLYLLVIAIVFFIVWARRDERLKMAWRQILRNKLALVAMIILSCYTIIALLDSVHFYTTSKVQSRAVISVFDYLIRPLGTHDEKTYSAPFATQLYTKEMVMSADGTVQSIYPSLRYGPHILGTDKVGQDVFYQTLKSIRTGLVIGTLTTLITLPFAIIFGMFAGYFRGWADDAIQYIYTTLSSIPDVLLIAAAILAWQLFMLNHPESFPTLLQRADIRLLTLCIILGVTSWTGLCRVLRGETLKLREMEYVQAARALGVTPWRILVKHILPNLMHLVLILVVMDFSVLVLAEAVLTYVGVGVDPTTMSWGNMINAARLELAREPMVWWPLLAAFLFMFPLVICANLFADAIRDALDPRLANPPLNPLRRRGLSPKINSIQVPSLEGTTGVGKKNL